MAQDKIGQSQAFYTLLQNLGESDPDTLAFLRPAANFRNCHFVELPIGEYDFSLIRHFLFDHAELLRFQLLSTSSYEPLTLIANKIRGEIKYHVMHADLWVKQLGTSTDESIERLQNSLNFAMPYALGMFEESKYEALLIEEGIFIGEALLKEKWLENITNILNKTSLQLPEIDKIIPETGGRIGKHTPYLHDLLVEMGEVFRLDPGAEW
jgi:ring-1,2-phenylacetyl-CoA epoxidase subunit PaaC